MFPYLRQLWLEFWIAKKILIKGRKKGFLSFISLSSILGITLGVMTLVVVMSVMNGFHKELRSRILSATSHIEILGDFSSAEVLNEINSELINNQNIKSFAPFIHGEALLSNKNDKHGSLIRGVDSNQEKSINNLLQNIISGSSELSANDSIILGIDLAKSLSLKVGDSVSLYVPQLRYTVIGAIPKIKNFKVTGIFDAGIYEFDSSLALINIDVARKLFFDEKILISGVRVQLKNAENTLEESEKLKIVLSRLPARVFVLNWMDKNKNFFQAIQMEKRVMGIILTLIIAVAAFNLIASLTMTVQDKKKDIAILKTMGFYNGQIMKIFIFQGFVVGFLGALFGLALGVLISINIDVIVPFIENSLNIQFLSKDIYYINKVPSEIIFQDLISISVVAIIMSLIATIYPSLLAAKFKPAAILKNE
jgi:lipoprotein-releasing system permease protein